MAFQHLDAFGRGKEIAEGDAAQEYYLRPIDGRLMPLRVHGLGFQSQHKEACTWERIGIPRWRASTIIDIVHWTYSSILVEGSEQRRDNPGAVIETAFKWIPSCLLLALLLSFPKDLDGQTRNGGYYDPVRTQDRAYPKRARNAKENLSEASKTYEATEAEPLLERGLELSSLRANPVPDASNLDGEYDGLPVRHVGPRWLCFLQEAPSGEIVCGTYKVADWVREFGANADTNFVLVSYTRKQFSVYSAAAMAAPSWSRTSAEEKAERARLEPGDVQTLKNYGIHAALAAGVPAFWLDIECIRNDEDVAEANSSSPDVNRICDIVRAAHSLVILVGPPLETRYSWGQQQDFSPDNMTAWLQLWGSRLWTLPEILLCSNEHRIKIFAIGDPTAPLVLAKRNLAARAVWRDLLLIRELMDHYDGTIHLTPLELVSIALKCFANRQTDIFAPGDMSYALMGLLRRRPETDNNDTGFEAFARLSLANDSHSLLERLICMQQVQPGRQWFDLEDAWGAKLWDIEPKCQIAAIAHDQTVVLDGAYGASIQWDKLEQVASFKRPTMARLVGKIILRTSTIHFAISTAMVVIGAKFGRVFLPFLIFGLVFFIPSALIVLTAPAMLMNIYRGKYWSTQALFFGIEGIPSDIGDIERRLFGFNHGRLKWSVAGSTLSRHALSADGQRIGLPPFHKTPESDGEPQFLFTLVDTYAMTATAFSAARPPSALIVCGQEGGMQRAALCSYDFKRNAFAREQVIRVPTPILDRMFRMPRFRFALKHEDGPVAALPAGHVASWAHEKPSTSTGMPTWQKDVALIPFMFFTIALSFFTTRPTEGVASGVGYLLIQLLVPFCISRINLGHAIAVAVLVNGVVDMPYWAFQGYAGDPPHFEGLALLSGASKGFLAPAYVYLTYAWYKRTSEQATRTIVWACGPVFFGGLYMQLASAPAFLELRKWYLVAWCALCILLAYYAFFMLGTPDQVRWGPGDRAIGTQAEIKDVHTWKLNRLWAVLRKVETYLVACFILLVALSTYMLSHDLKDQKKYTFLFLVILPLLCIGLLSFFFVRYRPAIVLVFVVLAILSFAGQYLAPQNAGSLYVRQTNKYPALGLAFLSSFPSLSFPFICSIPMVLAPESFDFLSTLFVVFTADGLGSFLLSIVQLALFDPELDVVREHGGKIDKFQHDYTLYASVLFGLKLAALAAWGGYRFWISRRGRSVERTQGGFTTQAYAPVA